MNCTKKRNVQQLVCCVVMCCTLLQSGTDKHAETEIVGPEVSFVRSVMDKAIANDIVIVSAVGNGNAKGIGINAQDIWPACYTEGITVASVNNEDIISKFSNYGDMVDLCAPGEGIRSSVLNGGYENEDGTSMACPFVTAAAALLLSDSPSMTYQEVTRKLEEMAIDLGDVGYDIHYGYGRVNLLDYEIIPMGVDTQNEQTDIEDIGDITLSGIKNVAKGVQLEWNKVGDVDGYYVYRKTQESGYKKIGVLENSNTNTYVDQSAKNGVFYQYKVVAYSGEQRGICTNVKKIVYLTPIRCNITLPGRVLSQLKLNSF